MKHAYTKEQMQAAIDKAFAGSEPISFDAIPGTSLWGGQKPARLDLIKYALAALPEPEPPTVDGKPLAEVAFDAAGYSFSWMACQNKDRWHRIASAMFAAFGGKDAEALASLSTMFPTITFDPVQPIAFTEAVGNYVAELREDIKHGEEVRLADLRASQPTKIPWTEWHGGLCPLKDEEVEEWEYKLRKGFHCNTPGRPSNYSNNWIHENHNNPYDIIAYRVLKWREGFGPVDWKAMYEDANKNLRAKFEPEVKGANDRAEKAEAELARIIEAAHEAGWNGVDNPKDLAQFIKRQVEELAQSRYVNAELIKDKLTQSQLSQLRPIAEAGPVPEGRVRVTGFYANDLANGAKGWVLTEWASPRDTHFADIRLPAPAEKPDPYAELKAAHAAGKVIQALSNKGWYDTEPSWSRHGQYRIKPELETFEARGKIWTCHTPGDAMPCDRLAKVHVLCRDPEAFGPERVSPAYGINWEVCPNNAFDVIGWRYADEPTPEPLEPEPTTANANPVEDMALGGQMYWRDLARQLADVWWKCHNVGASLQHGDIDTDVSFSVCCELHGGKVFHADTPLNAWLKAEKWLMSPDRENFPTACLQPA